MKKKKRQFECELQWPLNYRVHDFNYNYQSRPWRTWHSL